MLTEILPKIGNQKIKHHTHTHTHGFLGGSVLMNPPANAGIVRDMGSILGSDTLEKGMATHYNILV